MVLQDYIGGGKPTAVIIDIAAMGLIGSAWLGYLSEAGTVVATTVLTIKYCVEIYESKLARRIVRSIRRFFQD